MSAVMLKKSENEKQIHPIIAWRMLFPFTSWLNIVKKNMVKLRMFNSRISGRWLTATNHPSLPLTYRSVNDHVLGQPPITTYWE